MRNLDEIIRARHSQRVPFAPLRRRREADVQAILEAARLAELLSQADVFGE